ncbi:MAG: DUF2202 domain-containing protein [Deltaproteobacteria bacterium]
MKKQIVFFLTPVLFIFIIAFSSGCDKKELVSEDQFGLISFRGPDSVNCTLVNPSPTVNNEEIEMIRYMREEEKLARDVYLFLYDKYNVKIFSNIAKSEQRHMDRIKCLLDYYQIGDPALAEAGKFSNPAFKELYDNLIATGSQSVLDAYKVGATIEDLDINDLDEDLDLTQNPAIISIFESLMCGSRNHLRGFYTNIVNASGTYSPQYISQELFQSIVTTSREFCGNNDGNNCNSSGKGSGKGKKHGNKNGNCNNSNTGNGGNGNGGNCNGNGGNGNGGNGNGGNCNGNGGNGNGGNGNGGNGNGGNGNGGNGNGGNGNGNGGNGNGGNGNGGNGNGN